MAPRLKVFKTTIGFNETAVAVSSRKAALEAWGVSQDLFASGAAEEVTDEKAPERAALDHPGVVLTRPVGKKTPYAPPKNRKRS